MVTNSHNYQPDVAYKYNICVFWYFILQIVVIKRGTDKIAALISASCGVCVCSWDHCQISLRASLGHSSRCWRYACERIRSQSVPWGNPIFWPVMSFWESLSDSFTRMYDLVIKLCKQKGINEEDCYTLQCAAFGNGPCLVIKIPSRTQLFSKGID